MHVVLVCQYLHNNTGYEEVYQSITGEGSLAIAVSLAYNTVPRSHYTAEKNKDTTCMSLCTKSLHSRDLSAMGYGSRLQHGCMKSNFD